MNYLNSSNLDVEKLLPKKLNKTTIGLSLAGFATLILSGIFVKRKVKAQEKTPREQQLGLIAINKKPPGLVNFGNTCFVNSVLQALASMPKFIRNLEELCRYDDFKELKLKVMQSGKKSNTAEKAQQVRKHKEAQLGINEYSSLVCKELLSILHVLNDDSIGNDEFSYQPSDLISLLEDSNDYLSFREQQDSHEVLKLIINCFDDTLKKGNYHKSDLVNISKKELALSNSLLGYLNTYLQCTACDKKFNNRIEAFYDLSLDILDRSVNSLKDTLKNYFLDEFIDDVQCLHCSIAAFISEREFKVIKLQALFAKNNDPNIQEGIQCLKDQIDYIQLMGSKSMTETDDLKVEVQKFIEVQIASLKSVDVKNMISGSFQIQKRRIKKVQTITKTPQILILHLKRLVINPRTGDPVKVGKFIEFEEELKLDQLLGLKKQENSHSFQLSSLISHLGMDNFGHYVTLRRIWQKKYSPYYSEEINQKQYTKSLWYLTSDREIRYIDKSDVFQARAYILFYEKMES